MKFSEHEEVRYFFNNYIDSFRAECFDYTDDHVCCGHSECGAIDADRWSQNSCRGYPDIAFSDHFSILVFETVVSGRLDTHTHFDQQSFMGLRNLFFGNRLSKDTGKVQLGKVDPVWEIYRCGFVPYRIELYKR